MAVHLVTPMARQWAVVMAASRVDCWVARMVARSAPRLMLSSADLWAETMADSMAAH